jgi:hypothetical protein
VQQKQFLNREQIDRVHDYASIFNTDAGKRVLEDLDLSFGGDCHVKGDPYHTHVRIGENNVVLKIKERLRMAEMELEEEKEEEEEEKE